MIRCQPLLSLNSDTPFWVSRESFAKHFDQADFLCRESQQVVEAYLKGWFFTDGDGVKWFKLPTVGFVDGNTQIVNGRHRIAVLLQFLNELPIAFAEGDAQDFAQRLEFQRVATDESFLLPDLPKREVLP